MGKILKIETFGLMVSLDKEIHGLAHISELSDAPIANIHDKFKIGQEVEFEIVSLEPAEHRLGLKVAGVKGKTAKVEKLSSAKTKEVAEAAVESAVTADATSSVKASKAEKATAVKGVEDKVAE